MARAYSLWLTCSHGGNKVIKLYLSFLRVRPKTSRGYLCLSKHFGQQNGLFTWYCVIIDFVFHLYVILLTENRKLDRGLVDNKIIKGVSNHNRLLNGKLDCCANKISQAAFVQVKRPTLTSFIPQVLSDV